MPAFSLQASGSMTLNANAMKTIRKWLIVGIIELVFCFWLLGNAASLVSSASNFKLWVGICSYLFGLLILPGTSTCHVAGRIQNARQRQQQLRQAFPDDTTSLIQLLDVKE